MRGRCFYAVPNFEIRLPRGPNQQRFVKPLTIGHSLKNSAFDNQKTTVVSWRSLSDRRRLGVNVRERRPLVSRFWQNGIFPGPDAFSLFDETKFYRHGFPDRLAETAYW